MDPLYIQYTILRYWAVVLVGHLTAGHSVAHPQSTKEQYRARKEARVHGITTSLSSTDRSSFLLGGKVKVEAGLEAVELQLAGGEEPAGRLSGGGGGEEGGERRRLLRLRKPGGGSSGWLQVGGVKRVDKRVDAGAVGAGRHGGAVQLGKSGLLLLNGGEAGGVGVELEVAVSRVVGVDKRVEVGVDGGVALVNIVVVLGGGGSDGDRGGDLSDGGGSDRRLILGGKWSRVETVGAGGNVGTVQDPEAVLAGGVLHGVGLAVVPDVAVLPDALALRSGLLSKDNAVLLGVGGAETAIAGVEALLLEDFGVLGFSSIPVGCCVSCFRFLSSNIYSP